MEKAINRRGLIHEIRRFLIRGLKWKAGEFIDVEKTVLAK